jgi:uncharacterized protein involved in exopolysaccharide biosynthesis
MNQTSSSSHLGRRKRFGRIVLALALPSIIAGAAFYFRPQSYLAETILEVRPSRSEALQHFGVSSEPSYAPAYVATQFEVLRRAETLKPVVRDLGLTKALSRDGHELTAEQALDVLRSALVLSQIKNTNLIKIGVRNKDPRLAANIANQIAGTYREGREKLAKQALEDNLKQFKDQVEAQRRRVSEEHKAAIHLSNDLGLVDTNPTNPSAPITLGEVGETRPEDVQDAKQRTHDYVDAKTKYLEDKRILDSMDLQYQTELLAETEDRTRVNVWETAAPPEGR